MATPGATAPDRGVRRDHGYHALRVGRVVRETADASTFVLDIPEDLERSFRYRAGQFCNFRISIDGTPVVRCYSMSSSPAVDDELQVTVKRVPGGVVSNWMNDHLAEGDTIEVTPPSGYFQLASSDKPLVAISAGSGITPVFSLIKSALAESSRSIRLLYANRDPQAVIFGQQLASLSERYPGRLAITQHFDVDRGFLTAEAFLDYADETLDGEFYLCGPAAFMELAERALRDRGVGPERIHIERFTPPESAVEAEAEARGSTVRVTIELDGRTGTAEHHPGTTILQTARQLGFSPPFSCESGSCATCMAKLVDGEVTMFVNNALLPEEVADGWVLTCQALPATPRVHVIYGYEG
jgi:ferredoxin-NADP reductase